MNSSKVTMMIAVLALAAGGLLLVRADDDEKSKTINAADFATLQEAFDAVPVSGGLVRIPPGRYELAKPLVLSREDIRVEGAGTATHLVNTNEAGQPALVLRAAKQGDRIWRVQLANFRVSGNEKSGDGILAEGVNEILIHNVAVDHNGGNGITLVDCYEDPRIADSILTYNAKAGLEVRGGHDSVVNGNQFEENQDALRVLDSFNLCMNGNNIDDHLRHGVVIENTYGSVVSGNMIEECAGVGIVVDRDVYGITLSANVLAHNNGGGIDLRDAWGSAVSANTFTINPSWSLRIGPDSGRITVTGNNFSNSHIGGKTRREEDYGAEWPKKVFAAGVLLDGASNVAISGNVFAGLIGEAVRMRNGAERVALVANITTDLGRKTGRV
ncbi:MAG: right-handed parallel beta-helix repeat-containing protein, partial [bacterium]|nr:right-handed parallel beta-helix repeat-containing protein [bacterium]